MSVELNPNVQLGFQRPFKDRNVTVHLYATNNNPQPVAFKVKTTAPKLYSVRPNSGRIEPNETIKVAVNLQGMKEEPPINAKCKDKFLVLSTYITPVREQGSISELWALAEKEEGENRVHQQKLKVVYIPADGEGIPEELDPSQTLVDPTQYSNLTEDSIVNRYESTRQVPYTNGHPEPEYPVPVIAQPPPPPVVEEPELIRPPEPIPEPARPVPSAPPTEPIPVSVPPAVHPPEESAAASAAAVAAADASLLSKYADAQAEIERLRALLAQYNEPALPNVGLRQRGKRSGAVGEEDTTAATAGKSRSVGEETRFAESPQEGVPPLVVILIALGVFITTYLFF